MSKARGCCLFERPHHQRIAHLLDCLDAAFLAQTACFFGGGTAIVLMLGEYRESVDVDLLCSSHEGYRVLRNTVNERSLGNLLKKPVQLAREVRADRYGIRTFCVVDGIPIKLEIVREDRIALHSQAVPTLPIPVLSRTDMYAEKLLANADRWADKSTASRDIIDLAMMISHWGDIPEQAWHKASEAYGASAELALQKASLLMADETYLHACLTKMAMDVALAPSIHTALGIAPQSVEQ
jgi:hypothetical protein